MSFLNKQLLSFNSSRYRLWKENLDFSEMVPKDSLVLDAGAGTGPYKELFKHAKYESADFEQVDACWVFRVYSNFF